MVLIAKNLEGAAVYLDSDTFLGNNLIFLYTAQIFFFCRAVAESRKYTGKRREEDIILCSIECLKGKKVTEKVIKGHARKKMLMAWGDNDAFRCVQCATSIIACE